ncbi:transposase [Streptomyces sp. NPDC058195]|uniref:transposase n=1 Tax=Streptomyces sp. NPDC058195 TaxID=3346375 RepID=UPI0036E590FC
MGRSRGGFTTKVHLSTDGRCRPLPLILTPGQRADRTPFKPVLERIRVPRPGPGRPRKKTDSLAADKAYGNGPVRDCPRQHGIRHAIPEKTGSQAARLRNGSGGGRPPGFGEERYRKRSTAGRAVNKLKDARAVATRHDKRGYACPGTAAAAALAIWLRTWSTRQRLLGKARARLAREREERIALHTRAPGWVVRPVHSQPVQQSQHDGNSERCEPHGCPPSPEGPPPQCELEQKQQQSHAEPHDRQHHPQPCAVAGVVPEWATRPRPDGPYGAAICAEGGEGGSQHVPAAPRRGCGRPAFHPRDVHPGASPEDRAAE